MKTEKFVTVTMPSFDAQYHNIYTCPSSVGAQAIIVGAVYINNISTSEGVEIKVENNSTILFEHQIIIDTNQNTILNDYLKNLSLDAGEDFFVRLSAANNPDVRITFLEIENVV